MKRYWIFTNKKEMFDLFNEFKQSSVIRWYNKRKNGSVHLSKVAIGDVVYIYSDKSISDELIHAIVVKTEIVGISPDKYLVDLKFLKFTNHNRLSRKKLEKCEGLKSIQGKREIKSQESIDYVLSNEDIS